MEELLKILNEMHPDVDFVTREDLIDGQILDSFDIVTLVAEIDDRMGVTIPAQEIIPDNFNSAASLYRLIESLD